MIGTTLGHFEIVERIGEGGMGEIYRARDGHLDRDVAIKVLPTESLSDQRLRKQFRKEALALAKLRHANVGVVYDFASDNDVDFLVMELIPGADLSKELEDGPLESDRVVRLGVEIAQALEEAHENSIVHLDLKPKNVMVTPKGQAKVLDFGLSKLLQRSDEASTVSLTGQFAFAGTLPYMAPEQLRAEDVDARTDVYALGATLYEMATGARPFPQREPEQLVTAILNTTPPTPRSVHDKVPLELERVILQALAREPQQRYQSVRELREDLQRLDAGMPVAARPRRVVNRRQILATAVGAAIVAVLFLTDLGGLRTRLRQWLGGGEIQSIAVLPLDNLSGDPDHEFWVAGIHEALITDLMKVASLKVRTRDSVEPYRERTKPLSEVAKELKVDALVTGAVVLDQGRVRVTAQLVDADAEESLWADRFEHELSNFLAVQSEIAVAIVRAVRVQLTTEEEARLTREQEIDPQAVEAYLRGNQLFLKFKRDDIARSIEYFQKAIEIEPKYADAHAGLSWAYGATAIGHGEPVKASEYFAKAKESASTALAIDPESANALVELAWVHLNHYWDLSSADHESRRAIEIQPGSAIPYIIRAGVLLGLGRQEEAISAALRAVQIDPVTPIVTADAAVVLSQAGRYDDAIELFQKALEISPEFPPALGCLAIYGYMPKEMYEDAIAAAERTVELTNRRTQWLAPLGWIYGKAGQHEKAREVLAELRERSTQAPVAARYFAQVHWGLGESDSTLVWLEKAFDDRDVALNIGSDPDYEGLRSEPRFEKLVQRLDEAMR